VQNQSRHPSLIYSNMSPLLNFYQKHFLKELLISKNFKKLRKKKKNSHINGRILWLKALKADLKNGMKKFLEM